MKTKQQINMEVAHLMGYGVLKREPNESDFVFIYSTIWTDRKFNIFGDSPEAAKCREDVRYTFGITVIPLKIGEELGGFQTFRHCVSHKESSHILDECEVIRLNYKDRFFHKEEPYAIAMALGVDLEGKYCHYCKKDTHNDSECWSTRPADWKPEKTNE